MAIYSPFWRARLPNTEAFLRQSLDSLARRDSRFFQVFSRYSGLPGARARDAILISGHFPLIWFKSMSLIDGLFEHRNENRILITLEGAEKYEQNRDDATGEFLIAKILHEIVHWGRYHRNLSRRTSRDEEAGFAFEKQAFGKITFRPGRAGVPSRARTNVRAKELDHQPAEIASSVGGLTLRKLNRDLPRGIRNNNPGNIKDVGVPWNGLATPAQRQPWQVDERTFCVFAEPKWGIRALARVIFTYQRRHQLHSIAAIIRRWAPPVENKTRNYIGFVSQRVRVAADATFDFGVEAHAIPMIRAIIEMENGVQPYSVGQITEAYRLARPH